jgi:Tfp pilus assembly protein PilX
MRHPHPNRRLADEAGFVLLTAVIVLFIITILVGAAVTVATQTSKSTTRDNSAKSALEASEGGLRVANYRVSQFKPEEAKCITGTAEASPLGGSVYCEGSSVESLGNSATFQYWTTKALSTGEKCAGETIAVKSGVAQRCITSEGKVNGVTPGTRLQTRVESAVGESLFSIDGILGLEEVLVNGSVTATAVVASNLKIKGEGSATFSKGFELCPGGTFKPAVGAERQHSGVTVGTVTGGSVGYPPLEITRSSGCPIEAKLPAEHATSAVNDDIRITNGTDVRSENTAGAVEFTGPNKNLLTLKSKGKLKLAGSKYYFCNVTVQNSGVLEIETGAKVEIFVDSHANNANCPEGSGAFKVEGSASIKNPNGPGALLIEIAGKGPFNVLNGGSLAASVYAPEAEVVLSGSGTLTGAVVGAKVKLEAGSFIFGEESEQLLVGKEGGTYSRKGWEQCTPGSGASEGC